MKSCQMLRRPGASGHAGAGGRRDHRHLAVGEAHPHRRHQFGREAHEPGVAPLLSRTRLARGRPADAGGDAGTPLDDLAKDGDRHVGDVGFEDLLLGVLVLVEDLAVAADDLGDEGGRHGHPAVGEACA